MSFYNAIYADFVEKLDKKFIVKGKCKPNKYEIIVYSHYDDIYTWEELARLNKLFEKYCNIDNYKKFIVTETISVKKMLCFDFYI